MPTPASPPALPLEPLRYHREHVAHLRTREPELWALFSSTTATSDFLGAVRMALLRSAYRLEPDAHPDVFAAAARAADALDLDLPITLYQGEGRADPNAMLVFVPTELIVRFEGNLLGLLGPEELTAVLGHELAHHRLWTAEDGALLTADRLLQAAADDPAAAPAHVESARRWSLATELYADRGAHLATGAVAPAVASLVKVATGMADVSGEAYLRQAAEVVGADGTVRPDGLAGTTHPETYVRAHALAQWAAGDDTDAASSLLGPTLDVDHLDLLGQVRLDAITQALVDQVLNSGIARSDVVLAHAGQFAAGTSPSPPSPPSSPSSPNPPNPPNPPTAALSADALVDLAPATREYLAYVLLDFAAVDPELDGPAHDAVAACAAQVGLGEELAALVAKELPR